VTRRSADDPAATHPGRAVIIAMGKSGGGDLAAKLALLATNVIAARVLGPADFAAWAGLLASGLIAAAIWDFGVSTLVTAEGSRAAPLLPVLRRVLAVRVRTMPLWLGVLAIGIVTVARIAPVPPLAALVVTVGSIAIATAAPLTASLRSRMQFGAAAIAIAAGRWVTAVAALIIVAFARTGASLTLLLFATAVGECVVVGIAGVFLARGRSTSSRLWNPRRITLAHAAPFAANQVLSIAYNRLDIVLVAALTTASQLAAYAPASRLQDAVYLLPAATAAVSLPLLTRSFDAGDASNVLPILKRIWLPALAVGMPAFIVLEATMPYVVRALLGPDYVAAVPAARIVAGSMLLAIVGAPLVALLIAGGRGAATTRAFAAAFGVSAGMHVLLDPSLGAIGAAASSLGRDVVHVGVCAFLARDLLARSPGSIPGTRAVASTPAPGTNRETLL
jgi:O-antigen/teichoic acid export membrane protein